MKKRTISKLKSIFGSKKGKRHHQQESQKSSRACTPEPVQETPEFRPVQNSPQPAQPRPPPSPPVPTNPIAPVPPEPSGPLSLKPCLVCGRTFNPQSLAKHVIICQKMTVKKRKLFDSSRQRREGTDLEQFLPKNFGLPENSPFLEKSPPTTAKPVPHKPKIATTTTTSGKTLTTKSELQRCPHCSRAFGVRAFERHVEWCADKAKILPAAPAQAPPHIADAKQRLNARTQYKAPLARGRRKSSQSRDKSHSRSGSVESSRGVSPPRENGEHSKYARQRASESLSSNEYHEDSGHVPVIRQGRHSHGHGDANVKARQARLARDLSSSRQSQESNPRSQQPKVKNENKHSREERYKTSYASCDRNGRNDNQGKLENERISEEDDNEGYKPIESQDETLSSRKQYKSQSEIYHPGEKINKTNSPSGRNSKQTIHTNKRILKDDESCGGTDQDLYEPSSSRNEYNVPNENNSHNDKNKTNYGPCDRNKRTCERTCALSPEDKNCYSSPEKNERNYRQGRREDKTISGDDDKACEPIKSQETYSTRNDNNLLRSERREQSYINNERTTAKDKCFGLQSKEQDFREHILPRNEFDCKPIENNERSHGLNSNRSSFGNQKLRESSGIVSPSSQFDYASQERSEYRSRRVNIQALDKDGSYSERTEQKVRSEALESNNFNYPSTEWNKRKEKRDIDRYSLIGDNYDAAARRNSSEQPSPRNKFDHKACDTADGRYLKGNSLRVENHYRPSERGDCNPSAIKTNDWSAIEDERNVSVRPLSYTIREDSPRNARNIQSLERNMTSLQRNERDETYTAQYDNDYNCISIKRNTPPPSTYFDNNYIPSERHESCYSTKKVSRKHQAPLLQACDVNCTCAEREINNHSSAPRDNYNRSFEKCRINYPTSQQREKWKESYKSSLPTHELGNIPSVCFKKTKSPRLSGKLNKKRNEPADKIYEDGFISCTKYENNSLSPSSGTAETSILSTKIHSTNDLISKVDDQNETYPSPRKKLKNNLALEGNLQSVLHYASNRLSPRNSEMCYSPVRAEDVNNPFAIDQSELPSSLSNEYDQALPSRFRRSHLPVRCENIKTSCTREDANDSNFSKTSVEVDRQLQLLRKEALLKDDFKSPSNSVQRTHSPPIQSNCSTSPEIGCQNCLSTSPRFQSDVSLISPEKTYQPNSEMIEIKNLPRSVYNNKQALVRFENDSDDNKGSTTLSKDDEGDCQIADPKECQRQISGKCVSFEEVEKNADSAQHNKAPLLEITEKQAPRKETKESILVKNKAKLSSDKNNFSKEENVKLKAKLDFKKEQKLKKLEDLVQKYENRTKKLEDQERLDREKINRKSLIPVSKTKSKHITSNKDTNISNIKDNRGSSSRHLKKVAPKLSRDKTPKKQTHRVSKENAMSMDSLESEKNHDGKSLNTELLCPCVPCIIHRPEEQKLSRKKSGQSNKIEITLVTGIDIPSQEPKLEILYKNENLTTSSVASIATTNQTLHNTLSTKSVTTKITESGSITPNRTSMSNSVSDNSINDDVSRKCYDDKPNVSTVSNNTVRTEDSELYEESTVRNENQSTENQDSYKRDRHNHDEHLENKSSVKYKLETNGQYISPQGSGDTYTKFSANFDDFDEFLSITDKMISSNEHENIEQLCMKETIETLNTPKNTDLSHKSSQIPPDKEKARHFSDEFEDLKNNLKELLNDTRDDLTLMNKIEEKPITIEKDSVTRFDRCQLDFRNARDDKQNNNNEESSELKLPSISHSNKPERKTTCSQREVKYIYKPNRRYKTVENREINSSKDNCIDVSDLQSISNEEPPLKLPRIEQTGLDDNYDPFASAARQMKELMSSDTNLPKKVLDSYKDPNRTLPILRPKEKANLSTLRSDNTKLMKDSLNKTYQKTPTLQRLKSFGGSNNENQNSNFGGRCSSFRVNRQISNDKKTCQKNLNTTFTKSSKENILTPAKSYFNRNSSLNRSFSSYTASSYSTPKLKDKVPKIASSMSHSFQRTTIKQPVKLDKIKRDEEKKDFVNLDSILADSHISDNSSMTDSNYIDPRLINENDNLPINVNNILNNPDILSSMESLLTQHKEILPTKFESFSSNLQNNNKNKDCDDVKSSLLKLDSIKKNNINNNVNNKLVAPLIDDLSIQYDKIMSSLEQSIGSKTSIRDDDSLCEDFDLEEFMTSFDDEVNKQKSENKRTCSSTTRVVKPADLEISDDNKISDQKDTNPSPKVVCNGSNGVVPVNKSMSLNFSTNIVSESLFPTSMKRSNSLIDTIQKKPHKADSAKSRHKNEQLEQEIMQSLKEIDMYYEEKCLQHIHSSKERIHEAVLNGTPKRETRGKSEKKSKKADNISNGNYTPNGKSSDSAYSSLNRISPSKLSVCNSKASNGVASLEQIPAESDSSGCQKDDVRSVSSEEFLAMERSAELGDTGSKAETHIVYKQTDSHEKRTSSRGSSRQSTKWRPPPVELSSSGSEASLPRPPRRGSAAPSPPSTLRLSRFCHECGSKFPVDTAKFCIECGVKRLCV